MEPAFYRGDLLFLTNPIHTKYETGDITVYKIPGQQIPIVHRVLEAHDGVILRSKRYVFSAYVGWSETDADTL
jgi:signal peptidase I